MFGDKTLSCIFGQQNFSFQNQTKHAEDNPKDFVIPYTLLTIFVLTTNLMLIYGFYKTSRPFTIITKLFIYLSMVDITHNLMTIFYLSLSFIELNNLPCLVIYLLVATMEFTYYLGYAIFATVTFLRYWSITNPLHPLETRQIIVALIIQAFVCGILGGGSLVLLYLKLNPSVLLKINYSQPIMQLLAVSFVLVLNTLAYKKLKLMKKMSGLSETVENRSTQRHKTLSEANICLFYITAFYIICPLPLFIMGWFGMEQVLNSSWGFYMYTSTHIFSMSNTGINSLIFILRTKTLSDFYKSKCCCSFKVNANTQGSAPDSTELSVL